MKKLYSHIKWKKRKDDHKKKVENGDLTLAKFKNEFIAIGYLKIIIFIQKDF